MNRQDTQKAERKSSSLSNWPIAPETVTLRADEVHVWAVDLEQPEAVVQRLAQTLSKDERERAKRFYFEKHQREYTIARGVLRSILAASIPCKPESPQFVYSPTGKPALASQNENMVHFNVSHSGRLAIYAITRGRVVGVDIEAVRKLDDLDGMARSNFSEAEQAVLNGLPDSLKHEGFFNCWTRKEAYIKALGDGLSYPLDQFDVTLKPGEAARLLKVVGNPEEAARWRMEALDVAEGYKAAVIAEGQDWSTRLWRWDSSGIV